MDILGFIKEFIEAFKEVKDSFVNNSTPYILLITIYTIILVVIISKYYSHKEENLKYRENLVKEKEQEYQKIMQENIKMKEELDSDTYQAFKISKGIYKQNLKETSMFK